MGEDQDLKAQLRRERGAPRAVTGGRVSGQRAPEGHHLLNGDVR